MKSLTKMMAQNEVLEQALQELEEIHMKLDVANATFQSLTPEQQKFHTKEYAELLQKIYDRMNRVRDRIAFVLRA